MIGDSSWLSDVRERYTFYLEQSVKRDRVPRPFDHFARDILFDQFETIARFLRIARQWEWLSPGRGGPPASHGAFGPRNLAREMTVVQDLIHRALCDLQKEHPRACQLVARHIKENAWDFARFGLTKETGQQAIEEAKEVLFKFLTRG